MKNEPIILNLSNYVKPVVVETMNREWVLNGRNNSYFDYIVERYNGSPTNSAIIEGYVDRIYGKGLSIVNSKTNAAEYAAIMSLFPKNEVRKIVTDFKMFGSAVVQVRYSKGSKRSIAKAEHLERKYIAPNVMNDKGEIESYWFCQDWSKQKQNPPIEYPAFGYSKNANIEVMEIKPYKAGKDYYADPDYLAGLQYAMLEEEIANYSVNHIQNGLSAGFIINFNNGMPSEEVQENIENSVKRKLTGSSNAAKVIVSFNDNKDSAPTVEAIPTNASHEQWQFWAGEARQQIMVAHRVTSPMLFGIKDNTGLGNNANELKEATQLLHETVIRPKQNYILDCFQEIAAVNELGSPLTFLPLEDEEEEEQKEDEGEETTIDPKEKEEKKKEEVEMSKHLQLCADTLIGMGEDEDEEWVCIATEEVDYAKEEERDLMLKTMVSLYDTGRKTKTETKTGTARPNAKSAQDTDLFKIRYQYAPQKASESSRDFCKKMVAANKIYRKEDILMMENLEVNPGWGAYGVDNYSIWLYKGGGGCHHKWLRKTYVKNGSDVDVNSPLAELISTAEARRRGDKTRNEREVSMKPKDLPNNGFIQKR